MSETYPGQMLPELQEKTTVDSNDLFYMVSSNASKKIKGSNLKAQMKPSDYTGATSSTNGANGLVPQPTTSDVDRFLKGDGTWGDISYAVGEASGSIATFSDGSELPMRSLKAYIEPVQDLHGYDSPWVGGAGKNKFDQDTVYASYKQSDSSFRITGNAATLMKNYIPQSLVGQQVTVSVYFDLTKEASPNGVRIAYNIGGTETESSRVETNQKKTLSLTFTPTATTDYWYITYGNTGTNYFTFKDCQLEEGSSATSFAPYSNICPIIGWDECNVTRCGKNLFDKTATDTSKGFISGKWINQTGNTFSYGDWNVSEYIRVDGEKIAVSGMTVSAQVSSGRGGYCCYDKYKNVLGGGTYNALTQIITLPTNTEYIRISVWNENKDVCQLELNDEATTYEAYNGHTYTIDLDGTRYGGTLDVVSGVLTVTWIRRNMGSLTYAKSQSGLFQTSFGDIKKPSTNTQPTGWVISSIYKEIDARSITGPQGSNPSPDGVMAENEAGQMYFNNLAYTEVTDFKSAMDGVDLVYKLATPQNYQLTPTQVNSLLGENNVWADTGDVDVHYVRDLTITIDDILSRLEALEG